MARWDSGSKLASSISFASSRSHFNIFINIKIWTLNIYIFIYKFSICITNSSAVFNSM